MRRTKYWEDMERNIYVYNVYAAAYVCTHAHVSSRSRSRAGGRERRSERRRTETRRRG